MTVGFNPMVSSNRQQKTNFKALPIDKITKSGADARMFLTSVKKGNVLKTDENINDLNTAITKAIKEKALDVKSYLEEVRDEVWKVKQ